MGWAEQQLAQLGQDIAQLFRRRLVTQRQRGPEQPPIAHHEVLQLHLRELGVGDGNDGALQRADAGREPADLLDQANLVTVAAEVTDPNRLVGEQDQAADVVRDGALRRQSAKDAVRNESHPTHKLWSVPDCLCSALGVLQIVPSVRRVVPVDDQDIEGGRVEVVEVHARWKVRLVDGLVGMGWLLRVAFCGGGVRQLAGGIGGFRFRRVSSRNLSVFATPFCISMRPAMQFISIMAFLRHPRDNSVITRSEDHRPYSRLAIRPGSTGDCDVAIGLAEEAALGGARSGEQGALLKYYHREAA